MLESAMRFHAIVQSVLSRVPEWSVAEIVRERNGFDQIFVEPQVARHRTRDLCDLETVGQAVYGIGHPRD